MSRHSLYQRKLGNAIDAPLEEASGVHCRSLMKGTFHAQNPVRKPVRQYRPDIDQKSLVRDPYSPRRR